MKSQQQSFATGLDIDDDEEEERRLQQQLSLLQSQQPHDQSIEEYEDDEDEVDLKELLANRKSRSSYLSNISRASLKRPRVEEEEDSYEDDLNLSSSMASDLAELDNIPSRKSRSR